MICSATRQRRRTQEEEYDSYNNNDNDDQYETRNYVDDDDDYDDRLEDGDDDNNENNLDKPNQQVSSKRTNRRNGYDNSDEYEYEDDDEYDEDDTDDDTDDDDFDQTNPFSKSPSRRRTSPSSTSNTINNEAASAPRRRGGVYRVTFDGDDIPTDPSSTSRSSTRSSSSLPEQLEWEVLNDERATTYILLPPAHVQRPSAIVHFCGATWFGSAPHVWYNPLLQALVRQTNCVVVATSIPITLWRNPLQHKQLALSIQRHFCHAWQDVILDEYDNEFFQQENDDKAEGSVTVRIPPVVGVGHSLGARLLTILATLSSTNNNNNNNDDDNQQQKGRRRGRSMLQQQYQQPPPYQSLVLMSFTNYGASVGIPGIQALWQQSRKLERWQQEQDSDTSTSSRSRQQQQEASGRRGSRRRRSSSRNQKSMNSFEYDEYEDEDYDDNDDDDEEDNDLDWGDIWQDVVNAVGEQATRVQSLLTPRSDDLEVYPTPDQLWKALQKQERYNIPQTLLVQFDDDPIDQSAKLAHMLSSAIPSHLQNTTASTTASTPSSHRDIKFCRLRGSHLTPIFGSSFSHWLKPRGGSKWPSRATKALWKLLRGQPAVEADASMIELRQSVARYITDVVVAAAAASTSTAAAAAGTTVDKKK